MNKFTQHRSLFVVFSVLIVLAITVVGALGFYLGNVSSLKLGSLGLTDTQDVSAALDTDAAFDDGDISAKECAFNGGMAYCVPKYAFANQKSSLLIGYFPYGFGEGNPPSTPEWEITICKKKYTTTEISKEYKFRFPNNKECSITIKVLPGTEFERVFTKEYKTLSNFKNFKMTDPTYAKEIGVDYDATPISGDLASDLAKKGITEAMIEDVVWDYRYTSEYCSADVSRNFTIKTKYSGFLHPYAVGKCRVKLTAYVVTCKDCASTSRIVYTSSSTLTTKVLEEGIMPSPTSYWYPPTATPSPRPTPSVYPTISAIGLEPATTSVPQNSEIDVSIIARPPSDNIKGLEIKLKVEGATIVQGSYRTVDGNMLTVGTCNDTGALTTSDKVCVDVASMGTINTNQIIGSFKILANTISPVLIKTDVGNAYFVDDVLYYSDEETLGNYTLTP